MSTKNLKRTSVITTIVGIIVTKTADDESIKKLVNEVWKENKDSIVKDLNLKKEPTINFTNLDGAVMATVHTYRVQGYAKTIIETESSYVIDVDIKAVRDTINYYLGMITFRPFSNIGMMVVKQLLCHESRHIYQAQEGFYIGKDTLFADYRSAFEGYGNRPQELDANEWALTRASNEKEVALFTVQKANQECIGKLFADRDELRHAARNLVKVFWKM